MLDPDAVVLVASHACGELGCADTDTTILVLRPGHPAELLRLSQSLSAVTDPELREALTPILGESEGLREPSSPADR
jgi:hypothetical protein